MLVLVIGVLRILNLPKETHGLFLAKMVHKTKQKPQTVCFFPKIVFLKKYPLTAESGA